jgi:3'-phosphoadenosine 5'-phosphosulfate sulfotransferase (PAPS reductase)/FAD synthetase
MNTTHIALFSGGKDSLIATHYAFRHFPIDFVMYLDTNSGLPENLDYVKSVCDAQDWPLQIEKSPTNLREFVKKYGFPGPSIHSWAYRYFKERQLERVAKQYSNVIYYSGVRSAESERRFRNVEGKYNESRRWSWVNPIHHFTDDQCANYIEHFSLHVNPSYQTIGRSGDCYCGAYAHRHTELGELKEFYPHHYDFLMELESEAEEYDLPINRKSWGWGNLNEKELRSLVAANDDEQMMLCSNCDVNL